jgi:hypothetical protein
MKIKSNSLVRFITDFKLEGKYSTICFEARLLYTTLKKQIQLLSEVHIIHLHHTGMELIYLLAPDVVKYGIPDRIDNIDAIEYRRKEFLFIKGISTADGNYLLSIHPTGASCEPQTLKELHAKTYN